MNIFETRYEIRLISSKGVRTSFNKCIPELCSKYDCSCEIEVKTKWFWFYDKYIVKIIGTKENTKIIEKQLKLLANFIKI
jgi:hypothetical protein